MPASPCSSLDLVTHCLCQGSQLQASSGAFCSLPCEPSFPVDGCPRTFWTFLKYISLGFANIQTLVVISLRCRTYCIHIMLYDLGQNLSLRALVRYSSCGLGQTLQAVPLPELEYRTGIL